jgi:cyclopropane fatty-acyl-phospholipid synthase-like methyltransferase
VTADYFDQWFADIAASDVRQQMFSEFLGVPPEVGPSNMLPLIGLQAVAAAVELEPGAVLVDVACGRGGPGMWISRETGSDLTGIDFSAEAIAQASQRRALFGLESRATFAVGTLDATGLSAGVADAVICIDAFQFAPDPAAAAAEIRRVLRPRGRVVLTSWEARERDDGSVHERLRKVDLANSLTTAGFTRVVVEEKPDWYEIERALWQAALDADAGDDPAMASTRREAIPTLETFDRKRRVMATALAP